MSESETSAPAEAPQVTPGAQPAQPAESAEPAGAEPVATEGQGGPAPEPEPRMTAKQISALARQEQKLRRERQELANQRRELESAVKERDELKARWDKLTEDPYSELSQLGVSFDDWAEKQLGLDNTPENRIKRLEKRIEEKERKEREELERRKSEENEQRVSQGIQRYISDVRKYEPPEEYTGIMDIITDDVIFELGKAHYDADSRRTIDGEGIVKYYSSKITEDLDKVLSVPAFRSHAEKILGIKEPKEEPPEAGRDNRPRTLTNKLSSEPTAKGKQKLTRDERLARASAILEKASQAAGR